MGKILKLLIVFTAGIASCGQINTPPQKVIDSGTETLDSVPPPDEINRYIHTEYSYFDSISSGLIIQNSFPKGGLKYTDSQGIEYVYAIFWTRIINDTDHPFDIFLEIPGTAFELPSATGNAVKIVLPAAKMRIDKVSLFDYGLTTSDFLINTNLPHLVSLQENIKPGEKKFIYFMTLFEKGLEGVVRAGLKIQGERLFYNINGKDIHAGFFNIKE